jgi:hypothetical protein
LLSFGLSVPNRMRIRVRFCVRVAVGFRAQFVFQVFRVLNLYHTPITTICKQSKKKSILISIAIHLWQEIVHRIVDDSFAELQA